MVEQQALIQASMILPQDTVDIVRKMAQRANVSMAEIVRRAISTDKLIHDAIDEGSLVLLKDKDNSMRQIIFK